jgi:hypothetical protein
MPGPGELRPQQPGAIIGRETGLARLRGLVDQVPLASQVLLVTVGGLDRGQPLSSAAASLALLKSSGSSGPAIDSSDTRRPWSSSCAARRLR